jgi:micrococcal nuclease
VSGKAAAGWVLVFLALALAGGGLELLFGGGGSGEDADGLGSGGRVVRVVDGDTVKVRLANQTEVVRYIGVDTPESVKPGVPVQCFAHQASAFNRRLVAGKRVRLRLGPEHRDRYGRLLAYVFLRGRKSTLVNARLVEQGYARTLAIPPNTQLAVKLGALERRAKRRRLGLWGRC